MRFLSFFLLLLSFSVNSGADVPRLLHVNQSTSEMHGVSYAFVWSSDQQQVVVTVGKRRASETDWVLRFRGDRDARTETQRRKVWNREDGEITLEAFLPILMGTLDKFRADYPSEDVQEVSIEMHKVIEIWEDFWEWLDRTARTQGLESAERGRGFDRLYRQFVHRSAPIQKLAEFIRQHGYAVEILPPWYEGDIAWRSIKELRRATPRENLGRYLEAPGGFAFTIRRLTK